MTRKIFCDSQSGQPGSANASQQDRQLASLRKIALHWMERLASFNPYLTGAVLDGTAAHDSDIYLQAFCESPKELAIFLLNAGIRYEVSEILYARLKRRVEVLSFVWHSAKPGAMVGIHVEAYDIDDLRRMPRTDAQGQSLRVNGQKLAALINNSASDSS